MPARLSSNPRCPFGQQSDGGVPGDFDCNAAVNLLDVEAFYSCATGPGAGPFSPGCQVFDADGDDDVDFAEFLALQLHYDP